MSDWLTSTSDLRIKLSDGPTDKLRSYKRVFGQINGTNDLFKTFEFRRVTDFTSSTAPLGVYVNDAPVGAAASDDPATGYFTLTSPPVDGDVVNCTYYIQWFLDTELDQFLLTATNWLGFADNVINTPEGLRPSSLNYAAGEAYQKLALRWAENISETYRLEDSPDPKRFEIVKQYQDAAQNFKEEARKLRDDFYTRQGQSLSPLFATVQGRITPVVPRR